MAAWIPETTLNCLPDAILSNIIAAISDVRSRNSASLVCRRWFGLERSTRTSITLRGNIRNLHFLPRESFKCVTHLDLSLLSPWAYPLFSSVDSATLIGHLLHQVFPSVTSLTIYARDPSTILLLAPSWPHLSQIKLVRWHQRPQLGSGEELRVIFQQNKSLTTLDLSRFYCWTDNVPASLTEPSILTRLNLLNPSFSEGFRSNEIMAITESCPNLREFRAACMFDHRYIGGFVGDECLVSISVNCPKLSAVHLVDTSAVVDLRGDPELEDFTVEDSRISVVALIEFFKGLPLIEELVFDVCNNIRESGPALEMLNLKWPKLKLLKLGHFHGISMPIESKLDGVALCQGLDSLSLRNVEECWRFD